MILEDIEKKLQEIQTNGRVYYGMVDLADAEKEWNYIVFSRDILRVSESKRGYADRFTVAIVREDYIPEGLDTAVIEKLCELPGVRLANSDSEYRYTRKPKTNTVVELLTMEFVKARKRVVV